MAVKLININQLRISSTLVDSALEGYDSISDSGGDIGDNAIRVGVVSGAGGIERAAAGLQISTGAAGTGISGGGGSALAVDVTSTVDFSSSTPVWTFGNETTAEGLFVTGTPVDGNHVVNKSYVDNVVTGLQWIAPAETNGLVGNLGEVALEALSPAAGEAYVVSAVDGDGTLNPGAVAGLAIGDLVEYSGTAWIRLAAGSGGFVADGVRATLSATVALVAPYTDATDDNKIADFDGTSLTGSLTTPTDGDALLIIGNSAVNEHLGYVYDTGTTAWVQFSGAGQIVAGSGITKVANTLSVDSDTETGGDILGVNVTTNGVGVDIAAIDGAGLLANGSAVLDVDLLASGGLKFTGNEIGVEPNDFAGTGLEDDGSDNLRLATQGNGIAGGAGSILSVDSDTETGGNIQGANITANGVGLDIDAIAGVGLTADGSANLDVDGSNFAMKEPVRVALDTNVVVASPGSTIDGVTMVAGDRVLLTGQTAPAEDGIYEFVAGASPMTRTSDAPTGAEAAGWFIWVLEGTLNGDKLFRIGADAGDSTIGTDDLVRSQFAGTNRTAGSGLVDNGNDLDVEPDITTAATASANSILVTANGVNISVDDTTIEGSNAGSSGTETLRVKAGGIDTTQLANGAVLEGKLGIQWLTEDFTGLADGTLNGGNTRFTLSTAALITAGKTIDAMSVLFNGVDSQIRVGVTPVADGEWQQISTTIFEVFGNFTADDDETFRVRYVAAA